MADKIGFEEDIKPIFKDFAECMNGVKIGTDGGTIQVDLLDYETVKKLYDHIRLAINGHKPGSETAHPMPPGRPLSDADIELFEQWIKKGMLKNRGIA